MPNIGPLEIVIVLFIVLLIFGPKRLPDLGRSMGRGLREFKDSVTGKDRDDDEPRSLDAGDEHDDAPARTQSGTGEREPVATKSGEPS